jgi:parvulin-like peptidyl-prolyl isomerase
MEHTNKKHSNVIKISKRYAVIAAIILGVLLVGFVAVKLSVAAVVNGVPISRWSIIRELEKKAGDQLLQQKITERLLDSKISKANISVSSSQVDAEIQKITEQVSKQGGTLDQALSQQGMTMDDLREQITKQKQLEGLLSEKLVISDAEVEAYIKDSKATPHEGESPEDLKKEVKDQLKQQKLQTEVGLYMQNLVKEANIIHLVKYK